ncbi:unnamed protein product [Mycena citricolor]|uniref:T6SS Phospholipase effector Tle1-like catalytic domain-containing protein n=1 Tax=Mycena citricolor TaxID=2018698 RepID=A0AAD2GX24_9AGAR|nr:unnamed protein product [Mycena citricolor]
MESPNDSPITSLSEYATFPQRSSPSPMDPDKREESDRFNLERTVPPTHRHRTLVLAFDGTGDCFDDDNSNVVNFFSMLKKDDCEHQLVYYQASRGDRDVFCPGIAHPFMAKLHRTIDAMLGLHLNAHVMGGYEFLMQNYQAGDKICLFGFSRGAYVNRAGIGGNVGVPRSIRDAANSEETYDSRIHKVGLLPKCNHQQVAFAYKMYSREDEVGWRQSTAFKRAFSIDVEIEFLGVWDTVSSVGFVPRRLPFTRNNTNVRYFRHAIALDEHRARFQPNFWHRPSPDDLLLGVQKGEMPRSRHTQKVRGKSLDDLERQYSIAAEFETDIQEVWFAGCHADVGGGALPNNARNSLARISLRWMIRQCFVVRTGIMFHAEMLRMAGIDPDRLYPHVLPRPPPIMPDPDDERMQGSTEIKGKVIADRDFVSEEEEDLADAMTALNDELLRRRIWWFLEWFPQKLRFQEKNDTWTKAMIIHRGRGRHVPRQTTHGVHIHRTVKMRMDALGYNPRANIKATTDPIWVD